MRESALDSPIHRLAQAIHDLARTAESDLTPPEKLELLCVQVGTALHRLHEVETDPPRGHERGNPHFGTWRSRRAARER